MARALSVQRLTLAAFRSYARAEVATGGRSVALSGPNGAGKTNLVEAVSLLVPGRGLRRAEPEAFARATTGIGWRLRAEIAGAAGPVEIVTGAEGAETRREVEIDGKTAPQIALARHLTQIWLTPAMDRLWSEGASDRRRFLDRMVMGFEPAHAEAVLIYEKAMRERNRLLREERADPAWLSALEREMATAGARIARARAETLARLAATEPAAEALFPRADLAIFGAMETTLGQVIRDGRNPVSAEEEAAAELSAVFARGRLRDAAAGRTLDGPHRADLRATYAAKGMPAHLCSTGEQKALLISLCLANARALAAVCGAVPVLLLDEVAAHLDAHRRRALYAEIADLGAQAWMTGTAPQLFDGLDGALRLTVAEDAAGSRLEAAA